MKITRRQLESFLREVISDLDPRQDRFDSFESLRSYVTDLITRGVGHYKNSKYGKKPDIDELNNIKDTLIAEEWPYKIIRKLLATSVEFDEISERYEIDVYGRKYTISRYTLADPGAANLLTDIIKDYLNDNRGRYWTDVKKYQKEQSRYWHSTDYPDNNFSKSYRRIQDNLRQLEKITNPLRKTRKAFNLIFKEPAFSEEDRHSAHYTMKGAAVAYWHAKIPNEIIKVYEKNYGNFFFPEIFADPGKLLDESLPGKVAIDDLVTLISRWVEKFQELEHPPVVDDTLTDKYLPTFKKMLRLKEGKVRITRRQLNRIIESIDENEDAMIIAKLNVQADEFKRMQEEDPEDLSGTQEANWNQFFDLVEMLYPDQIPPTLKIWEAVGMEGDVFVDEWMTQEEASTFHLRDPSVYPVNEKGEEIDEPILANWSNRAYMYDREISFKQQLNPVEV